jgi:hypothetical protein
MDLCSQEPVPPDRTQESLLWLSLKDKVKVQHSLFVFDCVISLLGNFLPARSRVVLKDCRDPVLTLGWYSWRGDDFVGGSYKVPSLLLYLLLLPLGNRKRLCANLKKQPEYNWLLEELATVVSALPVSKLVA